MNPFFEITSGGVSITSLKIQTFLKENNYFKYLQAHDSYVYVTIIDKKVQIVRKDEIIASLFKYVKEYEFVDEKQKEMVHNRLSTKVGWIKMNLVNWIEDSQLEFIRDTYDTSYFFFRNCIVKVTAKDITTHEYSEFEEVVWEKDIKNRDFTIDQSDNIANPNGNFHNFLCAIDNNEINSLLSAIGYILHRYKNPAKAKCVIFYDINVSTKKPNGRCGKTLICKAINEVRNTIIENGKATDPSKKFSLHRVNVDIDVVVLDDVLESFNFELMFPTITGDFTKEAKFENRVTIPFEESPKIVITSNYIVQGEGNSHVDRRIEIFISNFFTNERVEVFYGKLFFKEWDDVEYNKFYNTMIMATQYYLENGLIEPSHDRYYYDLKNSSPAGFIDKCEAYLLPGERYNKADLFEEFKKDVPKLQTVHQYTFTSMLKKYAAYKGWDVEEPHSGDTYYIMFLDDSEDEAAVAEVA